MLNFFWHPRPRKSWPILFILIYEMRANSTHSHSSHSAMIKSRIRYFYSQTRGAWQASMNDRQHDFAFRGENFHFAMIVVYISLCVLKLKIDACVWGIGLIVTRVPWHGRLSTKDTIESKCICIWVKFVSTKTASRFSPLSSI